VSAAGAAVPLRTRAARRATLAVGALSRRLHLGSGSVVGGRVGLALEPRLLERLGRDRPVVLVTGTNGKTTTTRLLVAALGGRDAVATNAAGSNLPAGLVAALAAAPPRRPAVLEVDEGYLGRVVAAVRPQVAVLLNLSRDQLDRVSEVRMVAARFRAALADFDGTVVANADDPLVVWAASTAPKVVWVGAGQLWRSDAVGCPACDGEIVFADDGDWWSDCGLRRPVPALVLHDDDAVTAAGEHVALALALPGRCNRANAVVAAAAAGELGAELGAALGAMAGVDAVEGRFATVEYGPVRVRLLLAKNPAGWTELLELLHGGDAPVVIGINARVADGHDPSWLWDVDFEQLRGRTVVATGERAADLAVRLRYAGVEHVTVPDQLRALVQRGPGRVEYVGNYTAFQDLRRSLARRPQVVAATAAPLHRASDTPKAVAASPPRRRGDGVSALRVVVVHPDLLGTYGDAGNGRVLAARAAWRGMAAELVLAPSGHALPDGGDVYCIGGGEDGPELQAAERLADGSLARAVDGGAVLLAVCAGYQLVGAEFPDASGGCRPGLGLLDVVTYKGTGRRAVGEVLAEPRRPFDGLIGLETLTGFENHGGLTRLGPGVTPLADTRLGVGNGDGTEGAWSGRVFGTYLHGPVLARNPSFADLLLATATGTTPAPLDDEEEEALHGERLRAAGRAGWRTRVIGRRAS